MRQRKRADDDGLSSSGAPARPRFTLESLDLYAKVEAEESVRTNSGAGVSLLALAVIALLVFSELRGWLMPQRAEHVTVDAVVEGRVRINFDISLLALPCDQVNLDAMDVAGEQQNGVDHDFTKTRLGPDGAPLGTAMAAKIEARPSPAVGEGGDAPPSPTALPDSYCGSCFGASSREGQCCNTCDDVRAAYAEKGWESSEVLRTSEQCIREGRTDGDARGLAGHAGHGFGGPPQGCRLAGTLAVNKVAGNFHIALGETHVRGAGHVHQFNPASIALYNVSHTIHTLSFGEPFPGQSNPLDGDTRAPPEGAGVFMYYIKVIPTLYRSLVTNQYSVSTQYRSAVINGQRQNVLPGLFFVYEMTPFMVTITEARTVTFAQFITGLCAILGGVVTLARVADSGLYAAAKLLKLGGVSVEGGDVLTGMAVAASSTAKLAISAASSATIKSPGGSGAGSGGMTLHSDVARGSPPPNKAA